MSAAQSDARGGHPGLRVTRPGMLTSLQDLGRYGLQHLGIVPGGAMDSFAHRIANALVGNPAEAATLECTLLGPTVVVDCDALVALYGAEFAAKADGHAFPRNRPVLLKAGATLSMGSASRGARAYLAVAGGFQVPEVLGSRSTYIPAAFGGLSGRAVKAGDRLPCRDDVAQISASRFEKAGPRASSTDNTGMRTVSWFAPELNMPEDGPMIVRAMDGRHHSQFDSASREAFVGHPWRISSNSNRMGYRLEGPRLTRISPVDILSEPTCLGTVQVPNDGAPIALMADHQTTGGYPKIAEIAGADIAGLAQLAPGASVRFVMCSLDEAEAARRASEARLQSVLQSIESIYNR